MKIKEVVYFPKAKQNIKLSWEQGDKRIEKVGIEEERSGGKAPWWYETGERSYDDMRIFGIEADIIGENTDVIGAVDVLRVWHNLRLDDGERGVDKRVNRWVWGKRNLMCGVQTDSSLTLLEIWIQHLDGADVVAVILRAAAHADSATEDSSLAALEHVRECEKVEHWLTISWWTQSIESACWYCIQPRLLNILRATGRNSSVELVWNAKVFD